MCLYPTIIKNPKYKENKKNKGIIPQMKDARVGAIPIGCGMCIECMKQKANNWRIRLTEDIKEHKNARFITLTYSNEEYTKLKEEIQQKNKDVKGYTLDNAIATLSVRRFLERWRKKHKKSVRHWLITELGQEGTEHLHLHGIIYTDDVNEIEKRWQYGYVWKGKIVNNKIINYVNEKTINYITKYLTKKDFKHKYYKPVVLCSPGIGSNYTKSYDFKQRNKFSGKQTDETYRNSKGFKLALPIYYRNKAYNEDQREDLWIKKLDEGVRYINGQKVKEEDTETYYKILKWEREKNRELGYGSPRDWNAIKYEQERRKLKQQERYRKTSTPTRVDGLPSAQGSRGASKTKKSIP